MDTLFIYVKHRLKEKDIKNMRVFIKCAQEPSTQIHLRINYGMDSQTLFVKLFENYMFSEEQFYEISTFGKLDEVLTLIIKSMLKRFFKNQSGLTFDIVICEKDVHPNLSHGTTLTIESDLFNNDECPVCRSTWCLKTKVILDCKHCICSDCLLGIVRSSTNNTNCPVCRAQF